MVIYCTTNLVNGKKYIGQDSNNNPKYLGSGKNFLRALKKYGRKNFEKEILQDRISEQDLDESEIYWIDYFGAHKSDLFYNIASGGQACRETQFKKGQPAINKGKKLSQETKSKMKFFEKGMIPWNKGKKISNKESLLKMSLSHLGHKQSEETKAKRANKLRGRKRPNQKITPSCTFKGKKHTEEAKQKVTGANSKVARKIVQLDLNNKFIRQFDRISDACRFLNKGHSALWYALSNRGTNIYGGYKWIYLDKFKTE